MIKTKDSLKELLAEWPKNFIYDADLARNLNMTADARYSAVKRALKSKALVRLRKGLYLIGDRSKQMLPDSYELALNIYDPSMVSLESALSYHGWIPEAVYTITCVTPNRAREYKTPIGIFSYKHVPVQGMYIGANRIETNTGVRFIADPWRALADFMYVRRRSWPDLAHLEADLRIDRQTAHESDIELLKTLCNQYPSLRVRKALKAFLKEIMAAKK